ncbi:MAG: hypothetical protein ACOYM3_16580 [Terrimicrobiaceae bacterium]
MKNLCTLFLLSILLASATAPALALQPGQSGWDNAILSFEDAKQAADDGNAYAQAVVSIYYSLGWKTEKNLELALKYAVSSAKTGYPLGLYRVGTALRNGDSTEMNEEEGLALQQKSFDGLNKMSGNPYAITSVGVMLFQGKVVQENKLAAALLYKKAADMSYAPAQYNYAMCLQAGHGIDLNIEESSKYLEKAAKLGYVLAIQQRISVFKNQAEHKLETVHQSSAFNCVVIAESANLRVLSDNYSHIYIAHKKTGLLLGELELRYGGLQNAVLSPDSCYLVIQYHPGGGVGNCFPVFDLSSGAPLEVSTHWPQRYPSDETERSEHFGNKVERIGIQRGAKIVFECEGKLFASDLLNENAHPKLIGNSDDITFSNTRNDFLKLEKVQQVGREIVPDGCWSSAFFPDANSISLYTRTLDGASCYRSHLPIEKCPPNSVTINLADLTITNGEPFPDPFEIIPPSQHDKEIMESLNAARVQKGSLNKKYIITEFGFVYKLSGGAIDLGTWTVLTNQDTSKNALFAKDWNDVKDFKIHSSEVKIYKDRIGAMLNSFSIAGQPIFVTGQEYAIFNESYGQLFCKDSEKLIFLNNDLKPEKSIAWKGNFVHIAVNAEQKLALGIVDNGSRHPNLIQVINLKTGVIIGNLSVAKAGAVLVTENGEYVSRGDIGSMLGFKRGQEAYPFEQFDLRLNRPDIVFDRLGAPLEAINIAKELREKRLKRMGVTEDMLKPDFHLPEIQFAKELPLSTDSRDLRLEVKASDTKYPLERLRVYVNDVPVTGKDGESLRSLNTQWLDRAIPVNLSAGKNKIQVSVLNSAGAESLYATAEVNCTAPAAKPNLYVVAMGVSNYANQQFNLKYAAKDAEDLAVMLKSRAGNNYGSVKELLLRDGEVTKDSLAKVREFLKSATVDDSVVLFMAGHGLLDDKYDYYFGTSAM